MSLGRRLLALAAAGPLAMAVVVSPSAAAPLQQSREEPGTPGDRVPSDLAAGEPVDFGFPEGVVFPVPGEGTCPVGARGDEFARTLEDAAPATEPIAFGPPQGIVFPVPGEGVCPVARPPDDDIPWSSVDLTTAGHLFNPEGTAGATPSSDVQTVIATFPLPLIGIRPRVGVRSPSIRLVALSGTGMDVPDDPLRVYVTSLGRLGSAAVDVTIVGREEEAAALAGGAVVLEPVSLTREATERLLAERRRAAGAVSGSQADAYCAEFDRDPPPEGAILRIAAPSIQSAYAPHRRVVTAASRVRDEGNLVPDSDPESYFHSIRQWAVWTLAEGFDRPGFEEAFVEHTRKNVEESGRAWNEEMERAVRQLVPGRWADVNKVLEEAVRMDEREPKGGTP